MNTANNGRGINLYLDPWLPVVDLKAGTTKEISLQDAMMNAKGYMLAAQTRVEKVSLLRTLCALAGTVLYRYDASGKEAYVKDADEAVKRWAEAFKKGFSENAVKAYGKKWEDYLYLHDEKYPFYQTPDLDRGKKKIPRTAKGAMKGAGRGSWRSRVRREVGVGERGRGKWRCLRRGQCYKQGSQ